MRSTTSATRCRFASGNQRTSACRASGESSRSSTAKRARVGASATTGRATRAVEVQLPAPEIHHDLRQCDVSRLEPEAQAGVELVHVQPLAVFARARAQVLGVERRVDALVTGLRALELGDGVQASAQGQVRERAVEDGRERGEVEPAGIERRARRGRRAPVRR